MKIETIQGFIADLESLAQENNLTKVNDERNDKNDNYRTRQIEWVSHPEMLSNPPREVVEIPGMGKVIVGPSVFGKEATPSMVYSHTWYGGGSFNAHSEEDRYEATYSLLNGIGGEVLGVWFNILQEGDDPIIIKGLGNRELSNAWSTLRERIAYCIKKSISLREEDENFWENFKKVTNQKP